MKNTALNIQKTFGELGSFWYKMLQGKARQHAKVLSALPLNNNLVAQINNVVANFINEADHLYAVNYGYHFDEFYQALSVPLVEDGIVLQKPSCNDPLPVEDTWYVVPFSLNLELYTITGRNEKELINGIDFRQTAHYIWFRERPFNPNNPHNESPTTLRTEALKQVDRLIDAGAKQRLIEKINNTDYSYSLFPEKFLNLNGKWRRGSFAAMSNYSVLANTSNMPVGINAQYIANYVNGANQSVRDFERFLNATANAIFIPVDSKFLRAIKITKSIYAYVFEDKSSGKEYVICVNTLHSAPDLIPNQEYYAGTAILPPMSVFPIKSSWARNGLVTDSMAESFIDNMQYSQSNQPCLATLDPNTTTPRSKTTFASSVELKNFFINRLPTALGILIDIKHLKFYALGDESDVDWHQDIGTKVKYIYNIIMQNMPFGFFPIVRVKNEDGTVVDYYEYTTAPIN